MRISFPSNTDQPELNDQIMAVRKQLLLILLLNLPLVIVLSWIYWPLVDHWTLGAWSLTMLMVMIFRLVLFIFFADRISARLPTHQHQWILVSNSALSGLLWGWAGVLFFVPDQLEYQLIILMVLIVKGTGSVSSIINSLPAFYAYFPASMLPISLMFLKQGEITSVILGLISLFFTVIVLLFGRNLNRTLLESLSIRYENQRLLQETEQRKKQAEKANQAKTDFLAAASHDLRQPIHAMSLLLNVLEQPHDTQSVSRVTEQMRGTLDSLTHLLNALLDISRLDAGNVQVNLVHIDILDITNRLNDEFQLLAKDKGLELHWPHQSIYIHTDAVLLEQVIRNLVSNAIRYTHQGRIDVRCQVHQDKVRIEIEDTGIGIETAQQENIFNEFYQLANLPSDRNHGLGLGLAIVDRIMKLLGCQIELVSTPQSGSCFSFELERGDANSVTINNSDALTPGITGELNSCVALLEDDKEVSEAMQLLLESWGCRTFTAVDSGDLLTQLSAAKLNPDIIISDLQLSKGKNGIDESKKISQILSIKIPVLIITGNIQAEQLAQVKASGLPLLYKPVAPAKLRAFLRSHRARQKNGTS